MRMVLIFYFIFFLNISRIIILQEIFIKNDSSPKKIIKVNLKKPSKTIFGKK